MERFHVGNLDFKCSVHGRSGPLVVLLHGYGGGPLDWHRLRPFLDANYRLLVPNLTPLFSSDQPITFAKQVELVGGLLNMANREREPFILVGSSYGGTLSFGLRAHFQSLITAHVMISPMPLDPLGGLKSSGLRMLFGLNMVPGALPLFLKTPMGRQLLTELGSAFGFGHEGRRGLQGLSERKLTLISKAVQRFAWIAQNEDWNYWSKQLSDHVIPMLLIGGHRDPLFDERDFRSYQHLVPMSEYSGIGDGEHLLAYTHAEAVGQLIGGFLAAVGREPVLSMAI